MVGATLGGGVGRYNGLHGMIVDALKSVRLVTAEGKIITASENENSDLFWGVRGAGFNFGIVLSATYQVYDQTNQGQVVNADFLYPLNGTSTVLNYFKSFEKDQPAELSIIMQMGFNPEYGGVSLTILVSLD
jgi:FAD/FMN-containing dehydrogenase